MKKILLVGNYGAGNHGDNLLMIAARLGIKKAMPDSEIRVMSPGKDADYPLPPAGIRSWLKLKFIKANKGLDWCDYVVFGGGGLLNTEVPRSLAIWGKVIDKAYKAGRRIYMLGQSFADSPSSKLNKLLTKVELVTVRDTSSYNFIQRSSLNVPVRLTADLVFGLNKDQLSVDKNKFDEDFVVINLRDYKHVAPELVLSIAEDVVNYFTSNTPYSLYLVPFGPSDESMHKHLLEHFKDNGRVIPLSEDEQECIDAVRHSKGVVSVRLHPCLIGMIFDKPVLNLSYSSKTSGLMGDLEANYIDLRTEADFEARIEAFATDVSNAKSIDVKSLKGKADDNFKFLKLMIEQN